jgi:hypothetical protein
MTNRSIGLGLLATAVVMAVLVLAALGLNTQSSQAAPMAAPTPISIPVQARVAPEYPVFFNTKVITVSTRSDCFEVADYSAVDLHWIIDETDANSTTLKLQYSNNNTSYVDGLSFVSNAVADAEAMNQYPLFGRWACVYAALVGNQTVTVTVIGTVK